MCENCGCTSNQPVRKNVTTEPHLHDHHHGHDHDHSHDHNYHHLHDHEQMHDHGDGHYHSHPKIDPLTMEALRQSRLQAERNRGMFEAKRIFAVKIASSQGSGKSLIIDKSIELLKDTSKLLVIEDNLNRTLDPEKVFKAVKSLEADDKSILFIENLADVRPTDGSPDLGQIRSAVVFGVTEGDNKPAKYPELFAGADICLINKIDLLPYVDFNIEKAKSTILALNPAIKFFEISAKTGEGIAQWISWVGEEYRKFCE
jgi:hydrogenase nickel incorporation protein HypB